MQDVVVGKPPRTNLRIRLGFEEAEEKGENWNARGLPRLDRDWTGLLEVDFLLCSSVSAR